MSGTEETRKAYEEAMKALDDGWGDSITSRDAIRAHVESLTRTLAMTHGMLTSARENGSFATKCHDEATQEVKALAERVRELEKELADLKDKYARRCADTYTVKVAADGSVSGEALDTSRGIL